MMEFRPITIEDKSIIKPILFNSLSQICTHNFVNLIIWGEHFLPHYIIENQLLLIRGGIDEIYYNFPIGNGDKKKLISKLIESTQQEKKQLIFVNLNDSMKKELEEMFPNQFEISYERNSSEYLYLKENLISLSGKKLQPKRNHIHQFEKTYNYTFHPMTKNDIKECLSMHELWSKENDCGEENCSLQQESCAVKKALINFEQLDMIGGVLRVEGNVIAFTLGSFINNSTFDVNIEKALANYKGAYTIINKLFLSVLPNEIVYINREEDMGEAGLRKAKLSYQPYKMLHRYNAILK